MASSPPTLRRRLPQPESITKATRKLAVEPVETSAKSNRFHSPGGEASYVPFHTRNPVGQVEDSSGDSTWERAALLLTTPADSRASDQTPSILSAGTASQTTRMRQRRFAPQLIETTRRVRKSGDTVSEKASTDKTVLSPSDSVYLPRHVRLPQPSLPLNVSEHMPILDTHDSILSSSRFSSFRLSGHATRQSSFRVPHLDSIESQPDSEESNESTCPSLSTSPSDSFGEKDLYSHNSRIRESCDDRFSGYLLALAARAAEKQFRDQAMAAYPNENLHEPVDHFAIDRESDASEDEKGVGLLPRIALGDKRLYRRESTTGRNIAAVRRRRESLEQQRKRLEATQQPSSMWESKNKALESTTLACGKDKDVGQVQVPMNCDQGVTQLGIGLERMRSAASPPMLGQDLMFPLCRSPQQTRIDATQHPTSRLDGESQTRTHSGLWTPDDIHGPQTSTVGLWHGVCSASDQALLARSKVLPSGLMTPRYDQDDPFSKPVILSHDRPQSLLTSAAELEVIGIDDVLSAQQSIEEEFHDGFITQLYNYLSLGYPSLARKYDGELSKISKVPLDEIRQNDSQVNTKGFIQFEQPESRQCKESEARDTQCGRFKALRMYVKEWARQESGMISPDQEANGGWGVRARKGSWAF
ncbi:hypothetical protein MMC34_008540 [Xylographa carneopallida]|nr:hypothetical protein [Xylographa carneopallida]